MPPVSLFGIVSERATASEAGSVNSEVTSLKPRQGISRVGMGDSCPDTEGGIAYVCPADGTRIVLRPCCHEWGCPKCLPQNAWRAARRVQAKLDGVRLLLGYDAAEHVVWAPNVQQPATTPEDVQAYQEDAWKIAIGAGYEGGVSVFHGERHEGRDCWRDGPHVHMLAFRAPEGLNAFVVGGIFKVVGPRPDIVPTVSYLVNHATRGATQNVTRYFGTCGSRAEARGVAEVPKDRLEAPVCSVCAGPMVREDQLDGTAGAWRPERVGWAV